MKLPHPFTIYDLRFTIWKKSSAGDRARRCEPLAANRQSPIVNRKSGVALVITLIMLSVTLVMAIAFLAISRRERNSVGTNTDTTVARLAADSALAAAQAQIVANILTTNAASYDFHLLVSTNYQNDYGFVQNSQNPTNVNYNYLHGGAALSADDYVQNVANLFFLPRAPVSINGDFRFYLDLNRNGRFETNGYTADFDAFNNPTGFNAKTGDPEWVGILERPDAPHSANNPFVARYAFLAQPIGNSLDLNAIYNASYSREVNPLPPGYSSNEGFLRNQGVGSWELNLAAFLADLNTNIWDSPFSGGIYNYQTPKGLYNTGAAFYDALALLSYRYSFNYGNLASANFVMGGFANTILPRDNIDTYSDGPLQLTTTNINEGILANQDKPGFSWAGANNPNNFFALPSELFDPNKVSAAFTNRLRLGTLVSSNASYDRYTFYRMLDQLGTDSSAGDSRMNLNYDNVTATNAFTGTVGATNLIDWTPLAFFTNAADRLIRVQTARWCSENFGFYTNTFGATITQPFSLANIPVQVNGQFVYTPAVNRLLQLAANIYDASTNNPYPSVFRPTFLVVNENGFKNVYINGFEEVSSLNSFAVNAVPLDRPVDISALPFGITKGLNTPNANVFGVPWIIGAKKGLPNFNQFYMRNEVRLTRKLQGRKIPPAYTQIETNQMYIMSITNRIGFSFWNSYDTNYFGTLTVHVNDTLSMALTNANHAYPTLLLPWTANTNFVFNPTGNTFNNWPGSAWTTVNNSPVAQSFIYGTWDFPSLPESIYRSTTGDFEPVNGNLNPTWEIGVPLYRFPQFGLLTTNWVQAYILDGNHVIDYVQLSGPNSARNLNQEINDIDSTGLDSRMWSTNAYGNPVTSTSPNYGIINQMKVSLSGILTSPLNQNSWKRPSNIPTAIPALSAAEAAYFKAFFFGPYGSGSKRYTNNLPTIQAPYTPTRISVEYTAWQANDPLVHYLSSDLNSTNTSSAKTGLSQHDDPNYIFPATDLATSGERYQPWGKATEPPNGFYEKNPFNIAYRDSLVWRSDYWDFPTNKYPSVGWLGRVHRGTPWQTIYLKATNVLEQVNGFGNIGTNTWQLWTGNRNFYDAANAAPIQDRLLLDVFTATPNDNAARGALSINQTNLAAWSALLSGLVALTNISVAPAADATPVITNTIISPASVDIAGSAVGKIHDSILATLADTNMFPLGVFTHVGDILRVPAFTEQSPFINRSGFVKADDRLNYDISDEVYEWLPQQTLGLLRLGTPRFVLYCYGQALRPAKDGQVLSGAAFGLVTNYQVVAESATRVVLRVDNSAGKTPQVIVESSNPLPPD